MSNPRNATGRDVSRQRSSAKLRLGLLLAAMVIVPLAALSWAGVQVLRKQEAIAGHESLQVFQDRLRGVARAVDTVVRSLERELARYEAMLPSDPDTIREALGRLPRSLEALVVSAGPQGELIFPPLTGATSERERAFLDRTRGLWQGGLLKGLADKAGHGGPDRGWVPFMADGRQTFVWWRSNGERVVALEVPRVLLSSELVMQLPETPMGDDAGVGLTQGRTMLLDEAGGVVYQWGQHEPPPGDVPKATLALGPPLDAWRLVHHAPAGAVGANFTGALRWTVVGMVGGLGLVLAGSAWLIWRARRREMQLAAERVSFVNQVSHELKTPLTNIRMYAELLEGALDLDDDDPDGPDPNDPKRRHLAVIRRESDRLSRLIRNVLTFAKSEQQQTSVTRRTGVVDRIVETTIASSAPTLTLAGITIARELHAPGKVEVDPDALEQVVANLLSNAEKYARSGGLVTVTTAQEADTTTITVADRGPGIPPAHRDKIFEPFYRISDRLSDGVTGTGIGLDIARRLARLHGGDLRLAPADPQQTGATFILTIVTPPTSPAPPPTATPAPPTNASTAPAGAPPAPNPTPNPTPTPKESPR